MRGGIETKPERNLRNPGVSFPPEKQKHAVRLPGQFHGKRNVHVGLFSWFLVHSGAPRKQSLKSTCFVSSNFSCFNFFPICSLLIPALRGLCQKAYSMLETWKWENDLGNYFLQGERIQILAEK